MDIEEILQELTKLINVVGPAGEQIFDLAVYYERIHLFEKLRTLIMQKDSINDHVATEVLSWAWQVLSEQCPQ